MDLMHHLPRRVYNEQVNIRDLQDAFETEVAAAQEARDDLLVQARPGTASWGLEEYEREYGLVPDSRRTPAQRLARWRAKRRGVGTSTFDRILAVAQSFTDNLVTLAEFPREYRFQLEINVEGPVAVRDILSAVEEIKPAHLQMILQMGAEIAGAMYLGAAVQAAPTIEIPYRQPETELSAAGTLYTAAAPQPIPVIEIPYRQPETERESTGTLHTAATSQAAAIVEVPYRQPETEQQATGALHTAAALTQALIIQIST